MKNVDLLRRPDLMAKRVEKLYLSASPESIEEGQKWYFQANHIAVYIANKFVVPYAKVVGVIASLSPATNWVQNIADSHNLIHAYVNNIDPNGVVVTTYGNNKAKAIQILTGNSASVDVIEKLLLGNSKVNKTWNFFWNIYLPSDHNRVTIDRHTLRIALNSNKTILIMTEKRYRDVAKAYQIAAKKLGGLNAAQVQAVCWLAFRQNLPHTIPAAVHKLDPAIREQIIG